LTDFICVRLVYYQNGVASPKTIRSYVVYQPILVPGSLNLINCSPNLCPECNYKSLKLSTIFIVYDPGYIYNFNVTPQTLLRENKPFYVFWNIRLFISIQR